MTVPSRMHPLARVAVYFVGLLGLAALQQLLILVYAVIRVGGTGANFVAEMEKIASSAQSAALQLTLLLYIPVFFWTWFCRRKLDKSGMDSLGLAKPGLFSNLSRGLITGALTITLLFAILWITGGVSVSGWDADILAKGFFPGLAQMTGWLLIFAAVAFMEELTFRGYLLQNLSAGAGWIVGLAGQAIVFALIHLPNVAGGGESAAASAIQGLPSLVLIAIFFGLATSRTGSLWFAIGFHWSWNFLLGCVYSLPVSGIGTPRLLKVNVTGPTWLTGGAFGAEASLMLPFILLALVILIAQAPKHPLAESAIQGIKPESAEAEPEVEVEEPRENRYRTRFNQTDTFDSDTLSQLREMQDARRREAATAARLERTLDETGEGTAAFSPLPVNPEPVELNIEAPQETILDAPVPAPAREVPKPEVWVRPEPVVETAVPTPEVKVELPAVEKAALPKQPVKPEPVTAKPVIEPEKVAEPVAPAVKVTDEPVSPPKKKPAPRW